MVTIRDISLKCNVSVSTVSKVLNGYREIGEETTKAVLKAAEELGYVPNSYARQLKTKKTYNIGVLFDTVSNYGLRNEYFAHILASFRENVSAHGYDITFIENNIGNRKMTYVEHCRYRNFDGICIVCADFSSPEVLDVVNSDFPVVTIDHSFNEAISIVSDNTNGMRELAEYIVAQGHKRIAYIYGNRSAVTHNRLVALHQVLSEHNIHVPEYYFLESVYRVAESAEKLTYQLLDCKERPTCIIAPDDYAALGVIKAIKRRDLRFPEDVSVAGYDGITVSQALEPKLTTVKQDTDHIGEEAAKRLISLMESPMTTPLTHVTLKSELIFGDSVHKIR
ncbi:MAG: LacI family DNA-binding transcriptional regulator [Clostridiales bacterium]|nr:LacI family DNA-binding transcriptional regulator [Clostridiales bacterium]